MDPAGLNRRKNATRETTSQLKHWLSEHRKNPYPTKGEKIMLAIVTKMTLTQVSTWFANARRRLKKENKMTWSPRNRGCEDDDKSDDQGGNDDDPDDFPDKDDESLSVTGSLTEDDVKRPDSLSPSVSDSKGRVIKVRARFCWGHSNFFNKNSVSFEKLAQWLVRSSKTISLLGRINQHLLLASVDKTVTDAIRFFTTRLERMWSKKGWQRIFEDW